MGLLHIEYHCLGDLASVILRAAVIYKCTYFGFNILNYKIKF